MKALIIASGCIVLVHSMHLIKLQPPNPSVSKHVDLETTRQQGSRKDGSRPASEGFAGCSKETEDQKRDEVHSIITHLPDNVSELEFNPSIHKLGEGTFGEVFKTKFGGKWYALKRQRKSQLAQGALGANLRFEHVNDLFLEKENMKELAKTKSEFLVNMMKTYADDQFCYILMELGEAGDLYDILELLKLHEKDAKSMTETVRFFVQQMLYGLNAIHSQNMIYRDLKPENIMVTANGYLKLGDFGLSKQLKHEKETFTIVGTVGYMAPEVILEDRAYGKEADFWSLGQLICRMVFGDLLFHNEHTDPHGTGMITEPHKMACCIVGKPFRRRGNIENELKGKINRWQESHVKPFPENLKNLILGLLERNQEARLGYEDAMKQLFFMEPDCDWETPMEPPDCVLEAVKIRLDAFEEKEKYVSGLRLTHARKECDARPFDDSVFADFAD